MSAAPAAFAAEMGMSWSIRAGRFKDSVIVAGKEWVGQIIVPASEVSGARYLEFYINPLEFGGGRLEAFARLYEKFLFRKFRFRYCPTQPTTQKGSVILAFDRDVSDATPPANQQGVRQYLAFQGAQFSNVWKEQAMDISLEAPETGFYTNPAPGGDDRLAFQGQVYVACLEPSGLAQGTVLADLIVEYDCELFVPQLEAPPAVLSVNSIGGGLDTSNDMLKKFSTVGSGTVQTGNGNIAWQPVADSLGKYAVNLAEGLYNVRSIISQSQAGAIVVDDPTVTPLEPASAPAPQPIVTTVNWNGSSASGDVAVRDNYVAVPKGGGRLYQTLSTLTGLTAASVANLIIQRISGYTDPAKIL